LLNLALNEKTLRYLRARVKKARAIESPPLMMREHVLLT